MAQTTESLYSAFLTKKLDPADTTAEVSVAPTITSGRIRVGTGSNKELIKFTGVSGNALTGLVRNLSKTGVPATGGTGLTHIAGTKLVNVIMHDQLVDKQEDQTFGGSITATDIRFSGNTTSGLRVKSLTTSQRLALTASNGDIVYDSTIGVLYQYIGGAWSTFATGSTPNASTTVAGKVEVANYSEVTAGTTYGETGAFLVATLDQIKASIAIKNTTSTTSDSDLFVVSQGGEDKSITQALIRDQLAASTTKKGTVEMAEDSEAIAGSDETRVINPKQLKNRAGFTRGYGGGCIARSDSTVSGGSTGLNYKRIQIKGSGTISISVQGSSSDSTSPYPRIGIYRNTTLLATSGDIVNLSPVTLTATDVAVSDGDYINVQITQTGSSSTDISNLRIFATPIPNYGTATIIA